MCALEVPGEQVLLLFRHGMTGTAAPGPGGGAIPPHHGQGSLHLAFAIPFGELAAWEAHLTKHAIAVESKLRWPHGGTSLDSPRPGRSFAGSRNAGTVAKSLSHQAFGLGSSIGPPADFQAPKPPSMWATFSSPMSCAVFAARAERQPPAQKKMNRLGSANTGLA